ncbi:MAG: hypothetical protein IT534_01520 [Bauldia sp.]|nr:hypothetical protein [Bauldia sp.]
MTDRAPDHPEICTSSPVLRIIVPKGFRAHDAPDAFRAARHVAVVPLMTLPQCTAAIVIRGRLRPVVGPGRETDLDA